MSTRSWAALAFLTGLMLVQASWILGTPPFRGIDEFDHAYRAASVAGGQIRPYDEPVDAGRGDYLRVPEELVKDAGPVCSSYSYTGPDNCSPVTSLGGDEVTVASAAARYHPAYYAVVGTIASSWDGADFVFAGRWVSAALCAGLWGVAVLVGLRCRPVLLWPMTLVCTPVLLYSQSVLAPNGIEIAAAVLLWVALLCLDGSGSAHRQRGLIVLAGAAACIVVTVRTLGPFWVLLIAATFLVLPGLTTRLSVLRRHLRLTVGAASVVLVATLASVAWILGTKTNSLSQDIVEGLGEPWVNAVSKLPLWLLQSIAAFPTRGEEAPVVVYATVLGAMTAAFALSPSTGDARWRLTAGVMVGVWAIPPIILTGLTYETSGAIWQGRYSFPYSVGIPLVLLAWARTRGSDRHPRVVLVVIAGATYVVANVISVGNVMRNELADSPLAGDPRWITPAEPVVWALAALGTVLMFTAPVLMARAPRRVDEPEDARVSTATPA